MALYAWIDENGVLCTTYDLEYVPEKYKNSCQIFEELSIHDHDKLYISEDGKIKIKTFEKILDEEKQKMLNDLKAYVRDLLSPTDWIYIKALELGRSATELYFDTVQKRLRIRAKNEELKNRIRNATSIEELEKINIVEEFIMALEELEEELKKTK